MHVLVIGCGPAGHLLAAACADAGLRVAMVGQRPDAAWPARYGAWVDELQSVGLAGTTGATWATVEVRLDSRRRFELPRAYGWIDGERLREHLRARLDTVIDADVVALEHHRDGSLARLDGGQTLRAKLVIDATGHAGAFVRRRAGVVTQWQSAWGETLTLDGHDVRTMRLIDFDWPGAPPADGLPPTFLYAMPLPDGRVFAEETVLTGAAVPLDALRDRLRARLAAAGIRVRESHGIERCRIPMNTPLPVLPQRVLGAGGAAGLVHPATGFMLAHTAALARRVAHQIAASINRPPGEIAARAWHATWPRAAQRCHALYRLGGDLLARLDLPKLRDFFAAFFDLPLASWSGFVSRTATPRELMHTMLGVFGRVSPSMRLRLIGGALRNPARILEGVTGIGTR